MQLPAKPYDNKRIFWDADAEKLDFEKKASFIIERVFERGDVEDIRLCRRFYGDEKIAVVLLNTKYLPLRKIYLASAILDKPLTAFKCYTLRQLNQELYPY
jgi:hypothetical protein